MMYVINISEVIKIYTIILFFFSLVLKRFKLHDKNRNNEKLKKKQWINKIFYNIMQIFILDFSF